MVKRPIAVLFGRVDSVYKSLGADVWDIERDALSWPGGSPVVAHPPCRAWATLRHFAQPRPGEKELAVWAIAQIRKWGGVLEHPNRSTLWPECGLPEPGRIDEHGGFTLAVHQWWWGHLAQKATRLYVVGCKPSEIPDVPLRLGDPTHSVSGGNGKKGLSKIAREATPIELAKWLLELAGRCRV